MQSSSSSTYHGFQPLRVTLEQAQSILDYHRRHESTPISSFKELKGGGYSAFTPTTTYEVILSDADNTAYLLKVAPAPSNLAVAYAPNTLVAEHALLQQLAQHTSVPHPKPHALDTSLSLLPHHYLLLSRPRGLPLSHARARGLLSERQVLALELRMGAYLKQLHGVENDWFGLPAQAADALYSWQEAFTLLLEGLLEEAQARGVDAPYTDVRGSLSRAIGFFLFDDCEVPSLVSFTGSEDAIVLDISSDVPHQADEVPITSFLSFSHALWGDPLMETLFLNPSAALVEGYGGPLVLFARQKTKRLWYTFFLSLAVIVQAKRDGTAEDEETLRWARETLQKCVEDLKDAPCY